MSDQPVRGTIVREHTRSLPTPLPLATPAGMLNEIVALHNMAGRLVGVYLDQAMNAHSRGDFKGEDHAALMARVAGDLSNALRIARGAAHDLFDTNAALEILKAEEAALERLP